MSGNPFASLGNGFHKGHLTAGGLWKWETSTPYKIDIGKLFPYHSFSGEQLYHVISYKQTVLHPIYCSICLLSSWIKGAHILRIYPPDRGGKSYYRLFPVPVSSPRQDSYLLDADKLQAVEPCCPQSFTATNQRIKPLLERCSSTLKGSGSVEKQQKH